MMNLGNLHNNFKLPLLLNYLKYSVSALYTHFANKLSADLSHTSFET